MIADYDRAALSLFPAVFPVSGAETILISINSPDSMGDNVDLKSGLSRAGIAGIVVGTVTFILLVAAGAWFCLCRDRLKKAKKGASKIGSRWEKAELGGDRTYHRSELEGRILDDTRHELGASTVVENCQGGHASLALSSPPQEVLCSRGGADTRRQEQIHELS